MMPFPIDDAFIEAAHQRVVEQMPELAAHQPEVRPSPPNVLLIYTVPTPVPGALTMMRITRAVVNKKGKIVKLSTSKGAGPALRVELGAGS